MKTAIITASIIIPICWLVFSPNRQVPFTVVRSVSAVPSKVATPEEKYSEIEKDLTRACWSIQDPQKALDCIKGVERQFPH